VDPQTKEYDLANHPLFLEPNDYAGIDMPAGANVQDALHTNQNLVLKATDVNTNDGMDYLTLNWCYTDNLGGEENVVRDLN
jgi:hypothetical protein